MNRLFIIEFIVIIRCEYRDHPELGILFTFIVGTGAGARTWVVGRCKIEPVKCIIVIVVYFFNGGSKNGLLR